MAELTYTANSSTKSGLLPSSRAVKRAALALAVALGIAGAADFGEAHRLGKKMRRKQYEAADAVILNAAGIDRRDRSAVAVAEQQSALEADRREDAR